MDFQIDIVDNETTESKDDIDNDLDSWISCGDEVKWDDDTASFVGWKPYEDQPKDIPTHLVAIKMNTKPRPEFTPDVKTSAITKVGLQELLELIDDKLKKEKVVERTVFDRKWRPPREQDTVVVG